MILEPLLISSLGPGFPHSLLLHGFFKVAEEDGHEELNADSDGPS